MGDQPLSDDEGRAFLGIPSDHVLPGADELIQDGRAIIQTNVALHREVVQRGFGISPIWEERSGEAALRASMLPPEFASRYFSGGGLEVLSKSSVLKMIADLMPWMFDDPGGAALALEDTHRVYCSENAPMRPLSMPYKGHFKLLSLLLADIARKGDGGLDTLEWFASLGLSLDDFRDPADPPAPEIKKAMKQHLQEMWDEEQAWFRKRR